MTISPLSNLELSGEPNQSYLEEMLLIVSDSFEFSSQNATMPEKMKRANVWARILEGIVPENRLQDCFDFAVRNHKSNFSINGYDIKLAWEQIEAAEVAAQIETEKQEKAAANPIDVCTNKENHVGTGGEAQYCNPFNFNESITLPCHVCRNDAHHDQRRLYIAKNKKKESDTKPLEILEKVAEIKPKPVEVRLSGEEIESLLVEHNSLVRQIVEDSNAGLNLMLVFDEGANCFCREKYRSQTFSVEIVRKTVSNYREVLEKQ